MSTGVIIAVRYRKYSSRDIPTTLSLPANSAAAVSRITPYSPRKYPAAVEAGGPRRLEADGKQWTIQNDDPEAYNVPGEVPMIKIVESEISLNDNGLDIPGYAIVLTEFNLIQ